MIKTELAELKKLMKPKNCSITRICGCYVDGDKNKKSVFARSFLGLPEEEQFKYFEILRKVLSGNPGKTAIDLEFPIEAELEDGGHKFLMELRESKLKDDALLDEYYDRIISSFEYVGNYLILVIHDAYDVPGIATDGMEMEDASEEVYEYLLTAICPVNLSEAGLSYDPVENTFHNRERDWIVELPVNGFLFPAFTDRTSDIHHTMYYSKDAENLGELFIKSMLGCELPLTAGTQKETFQTLIEETLGDTCEFEAVKTIHEKMTELMEEHKEEAQPLVLDKSEVKRLFANSEVSNERLEHFDKQYEQIAGPETSLMATNVFNSRSFDVKTPDIVIKVKPDRTDLIENRTIDGRSCLVVELSGEVMVNGVSVRAASRNADFGIVDEEE